MLEPPVREYMQKELVQKADVSKALVSQVVDQLEHHGFVERLESGAVRVLDAALLADEWREHYNLTDHNITRGHVYSSGSGPDLVRTVAQKLNEWDVSYAFSGLSSAWHYAPFASFRLAVVYVDDPVAILNAGTLGFTAETRGANVWVVAPSDTSVFWSRERHEGIYFASPLQTYIDLKGHPERAAEASAVMRSYLSEKW